MTDRQALLCPVDFSPASLGAARYAIAIASRFNAALTLLTVDDGLLTEVGDTRMGRGWVRAASECELRSFLATAGGVILPKVAFDVRVGKAAPEIVRCAREGRFDAIVMSTHGRSGVRKFLFGATAERVLRETTVPVLLTPPQAAGPDSFETLARSVSPVLAPVDFSAATAPQVRAAGQIAEHLHARLIVGHVIEPASRPIPEHRLEAEFAAEQQQRASGALEAIALSSPAGIVSETLIGYGSPSVEIARWVHERHVGLLVMALHSGDEAPPRLGSVTYRTIGETHALTLALAPVSPS